MMMLRFSGFDRTVLLVIVGLLAAVLGVVVLGDRVGVRVLSAGPIQSAHSTSRIFLRFSEDMDTTTVEPRLRTEPAVDGSVTWNGRMVVFAPSRALTPGETYTVILERGAQSTTGREVLSEYRFTFQIGMPRVAYLFPADGRDHNIYVADPANPAAAQQITFSPGGIYDYAVSPDGEQIAFTENDPVTQSAEIKVLNLVTGALRQVTDCAAQSAFCTAPVWRPDGEVIAYERRTINTEIGSTGVTPARVWLIELATDPPAHRPLLQDSQVLGFSVSWSNDGGRIAFYNGNGPDIIVYTFATGTISAVPSSNGVAGELSPDGTRLVFPEVFIEENSARQYLRLLDLSQNTLINLSEPSDPINDTQLAWHPDSQRLAVIRQYRDERFTRRGQIYLVDANPDSDTFGEATPLVVEARYAHGFPSWDPSGTQLAFQRFPELNEDGSPNMEGRPEIWTYNAATEQITQIVVNAFMPQWIP